MFCAPGLVLGGTSGVGSRFLVLRARNHFSRFRGRRFPFSCFARSFSFSAVPWASGPIFMFCAPGLIFSSTEGGSRFHGLRSRTRFRRYRGRRVPFSFFALLDSFSTVPRVSGPFFLFCAPGLVFGGTRGVGSRVLVLRAPDSFLAVPSEPGLVFTFCAPGLISGVLGTSGLVFLFCVPIIVFVLSEGVGSRFLIFRAHTRFRWYRGRRSRFHVLCVQTHFLRYRGRVSFSCFTLPDSFSTVSGRRVSFSCFARLDSFLTVPGASGLVFMFCAPRLVFDGSGGVGSRFHFLLPDSFSAVPGVSGPVCMFCASLPVFMFCAP
jgi:hypothetical protein